jgi:acetyl esterase
MEAMDDPNADPATSPPPGAVKPAATKRAAPRKAAAKRSAPARTAVDRAVVDGPRPARGRPTVGAIPPGGPPDPERVPWRRSRNRALYNRRLQRDHEHWPLATRVGAWLFSHPGLLLNALGAGGPVESDGRVLNRSTQALVELAGRVGGASGPDDPSRADPVKLRPQMTRMSRLAMPVRTDVHVSGRTVPGHGEAPPIPVRVYRQFGAGIGSRGRHLPPAIVYFHGGGWVTGDLDSHDASCRLLAAVSGCIVVSVAYRLAPEHPYPAAVEDALAAYGWVQGHADELGHAPGQVAVMGDSAGGNLAAVVALETRPQAGADGTDLPPPLAQGLIYPALDARLDSDSMRAMADGFFLTRSSMEFFRDCYLPDRSGWEAARVSPLLAPDHVGLAPALVVTAGFDPLRDDGAHYAEALRKAGVEVEYRCYDDQVHGFMGMGILPDSLALATEVYDAMGRFLRRVAAPAPEG